MNLRYGTARNIDPLNEIYIRQRTKNSTRHRCSHDCSLRNKDII